MFHQVKGQGNVPLLSSFMKMLVSFCSWTWLLASLPTEPGPALWTTPGQ